MRLICISTLTFIAIVCSPKWGNDTAAGDVSDDEITDVDEDEGADDVDGGDDGNAGAPPPARPRGPPAARGSTPALWTRQFFPLFPP